MANTYTRRISLFINGQEVRNDIKSIQSTMSQLRNEQRLMTRGSDEYLAHAKKIRLLRGIIDKHNADLRGVSTGWQKLGAFAKKALPFLGFGAITAGIGAAVRKMNQAVDAADNFEERLDNLSALTGLEGEALEKLGETAKQTSVKITDGGVRIKQSADDIVDAYTKVGSQRPELLKNGEALAGVTEDAIILSEAAKSELEPAVKGLTTTMNQFNEPASESRRIINAMAAGSKEGAADIPYLTQAIEKSGTTMHLMNVSLEENIGLVEAIAPNYAKAELAGNSLDKVFLKLKEKQIGYKDGVFSVNAALDELALRYKNGESAASIFGVEHAKMGELLVQNKDEFNRYTKAVTGTNVAIEQAAKNTNNAKAIQAQARNEFKLAAIELGQNLSPAMVFLYRTAGKVARSFSNLISVNRTYTDSLVEKADKLKKVESQYESEGKTLNGLLATYDDLKSKESLTKDEQILLNDAIRKIGEIVPTAITEFNKYGEAVGINKDKIIEAREAQRLLNLEMRKDVVKDLVKSIKQSNKEIEQSQDYISRVNKNLKDEALLQQAVAITGMSRNELENDYLGGIQTANRAIKERNTDLAKTILKLKDIGLTEDEISQKTGMSIQNMTDVVKHYLDTINASNPTLPAGTRMLLMGQVWEWNGKGLKLVQKPVPDVSAKSLIKIQQEALDLAKQMPETTEAEIFAKNQKISAIEKEIDRLKNLGVESKESLKLAELLTSSDEEQKLAIQKYFSELGEGAFENFLNAVQSAKEKGSIDFSVASKIQTEEEDQTDPTTDYAIQKYQETLDYKFALAESMYEKGLIGEQQYQDQLTELTRQAEQKRYEIKRENIEKYQQITGFTANFVSSIMDFELAKAGDNEEKKKQIRKKYADLNFAVTASQIISDTAAAVMKALAELGPIAGPIAAAIVGATGVVQLGIANAERAKVKGFSEGGDTGPGNPLQPAGIVHKGEYVIPQWLLQNPLVADMRNTIEALRTRQISVNTMLPQFASGGSVNSSVYPGIDTSSLDSFWTKVSGRATDTEQNKLITQLADAVNVLYLTVEKQSKTKQFISIMDVKKSLDSSNNREAKMGM